MRTGMAVRYNRRNVLEMLIEFACSSSGRCRPGGIRGAPNQHSPRGASGVAMISYFTTEAGSIRGIDGIEPGCWIDVVEPTDEDRNWLRDELGIAPEFVRAAMDDEETAHTDIDEDTEQRLVIIDCPYIEDAEEMVDKSIVQYDTHPISFIFVPEKDYFITLSIRRNDTLSTISRGGVRNVNTAHRTRFLLQVLLHVSQRYLVCLRSINRQLRDFERTMRKSMRNSELIKMLGLEKSLVYFTTSLKGLESTVARIGGGRVVDLYEDDKELLDDVLIEIRQAMEMCTISSNILNGITDTFSSVINNNLNITMRTLTVITLVLAIPTIVFSFYGMNVDLPLDASWIFPLILAVVVSFLVAIIIRNGRILK